MRSIITLLRLISILLFLAFLFLKRKNELQEKGPETSEPEESDPNSIPLENELQDLKNFTYKIYMLDQRRSRTPDETKQLLQMRNDLETRLNDIYQKQIVIYPIRFPKTVCMNLVIPLLGVNNWKPYQIISILGRDFSNASLSTNKTRIKDVLALEYKEKKELPFYLNKIYENLSNNEKIVKQ